MGSDYGLSLPVLSRRGFVVRGDERGVIAIL